MEKSSSWVKIVLALIGSVQAIILALVAGGQIKLGPGRTDTQSAVTNTVSTETDKQSAQIAHLQDLVDKPDWGFHYLTISGANFTDMICSLKAKDTLIHLGYAVATKDETFVLGNKDHTNTFAFCFAEKSIVVFGSFGTADADANAHREEFQNAFISSLADYKAALP